MVDQGLSCQVLLASGLPDFIDALQENKEWSVKWNEFFCKVVGFRGVLMFFCLCMEKKMLEIVMKLINIKESILRSRLVLSICWDSLFFTFTFPHVFSV